MSVRMSEDEVWDFVTESHRGVLTTLRRDGVPIAMPLWFACIDKTIYIRTRGKKVARLRKDPRASFLVDDGDQWAELRAVHLTGTADVPDLDEALQAQILAELDRKYARFQGGKSAETMAYYAAAGFVLVRFRPDDPALSWDNRKVTVDQREA